MTSRDPLPKGCASRTRALVALPREGRPAAMARCRKGYTRSVITRVVDCADMKQAWRHAFTEVGYRNDKNDGKQSDSHESHVAADV